jgi:glycosyltransferase involved in cell wall biosynthesis
MPGERLKVLHLSTALSDTGAGGAALSTHQTLLDFGVESRILFLLGHADQNRQIYSFADSYVHRGLRYLTTALERAVRVPYRERHGHLFSAGLFGLRLRNHRLVRWADIIHLNWVNYGFVDVDELPAFRKPIVWTMHDMWPFTGGCHYSLDCERFRVACGCCPVLQSDDANDLSARGLRKKEGAFRAARVAWVGVGAWMALAARESRAMRGQTVHVIPSGIAAANFRPHNQTEARRLLNLPIDGPIVLLGAHDLSSPYKGVQFSLEGLSSLGEECVVVTFGDASVAAGARTGEPIHLGFIKDPRKMALLFSAADLFLATSVAEAFGKTLAEAQCCGTPVVAFDRMGPRDIVEHLKTGYLARFRDGADVAAGIRYCLSTRLDHALIAQRARERFAIEHCTRQYVALYESLLRHS